MKAIIRTKPGKEFSTMAVKEIPYPTVAAGELKVKMVSSRINPVDMDLMKGFPMLKYKNPQIGGIDGAGVVMDVGAGVTQFQVGDSVFFYRLFTDIGTWAEEITIKAEYCAKVPTEISLQEAGSIALPLLTAYDSILQLSAKRGAKLLIHGVAGGVGFQALQVAKQMGLHVTGTANTQDQRWLAEAGLDVCIDYQKQDFSTILAPNSQDYVLDLVGGAVLRKSILLKPKKVVSVKYVDPSNMHKAGIQLPSILKWLMRLSMSKFTRLAHKHGVHIIGQVTGADGRLLAEAADCVSKNFISRHHATRSLEDIMQKGLSGNDVGKTILF